MFTQLIETTSKYVISAVIRDEALGDLWEADYSLKEQGRSKYLRLILFIWRFILLIKASVVITWNEKEAFFFGDSQNTLLNQQPKVAPSYSDTCLTSTTIEKVKQYFELRMRYGLKTSRKKLGSIDEVTKYWLWQVDRMMDQYERHGRKHPSIEVIVNSFMLSNWVRRIEEFQPAEVDSSLFLELVKEIEFTPEFLDRYIAFSKHDYRRQLIFYGWALAVYVISWEPGQAVGMHHHGHALDAIRVIQGTMTHWQLSPQEWEQEIPFEIYESKLELYDGPSAVYSKGEVVVIDRCHAHQIANQSKERLVTIHFRFGHPPEDEHSRSTVDREMLVWNQAEGCIDLVPCDRKLSRKDATYTKTVNYGDRLNR